MTTLAELIAQLEAATEGSRELDCMITLSPDTPQTLVYKGAPLGHLLEPYDDEDPTMLTCDVVGAPRYTTSIDAAISLIPANCRFWHLSNYFDEPRGVAALQRFGIFGVFAYTAATLPLAICIAALHARKGQP